MNVFINLDPYTTLDLFHPKQWLRKRSNIKQIETWKMANRLETKCSKNDRCWKRTQLYGLRTKRMLTKSYCNLNQRNSNHLTFVLSKKGNNRENESILAKNKVLVKVKTKFQLKLVKWYKKNVDSRSHLHKINEKIRQKLGRHTSHSLMQLPAKSSLLSQSFAHKINNKIH